MKGVSYFTIKYQMKKKKRGLFLALTSSNQDLNVLNQKRSVSYDLISLKPEDVAYYGLKSCSNSHTVFLTN
jgi:hypothetical protein